MPGKKKPIERVIQDGKKHLTKEEIAKRRASEVKAESDNIKPPSFLPKEYRKEFKKLSSELVRAKLMTNLDCDTLARYIIATALYWKFTEQVISINPENAEDEKEKAELEGKLARAISLQQRYFNQALTLAKEFGLTVSSRLALSIPAAPPESPPNKFAKFEK